jgi:hypothetical protein
VRSHVVAKASIEREALDRALETKPDHRDRDDRLPELIALDIEAAAQLAVRIDVLAVHQSYDDHALAGAGNWNTATASTFDGAAAGRNLPLEGSTPVYIEV